MPKKFTKQRIVVEVLREDDNPVPTDLYALAHIIDEGDGVGRVLDPTVEYLTPKQMADELYEFGSEPGFFQLDDDGNEESQVVVRPRPVIPGGGE